MSYAKLYLDFDMTCQWNPPELKWVSSFLSNFHAAASTNVTRWFACRIRSGKQASKQWCSPSDVLAQKCCAIIILWSVQHSQYPIRIVQSQTQHGLLKPCGRLISARSCWISFCMIFWCSTTIITEITIWKILWRNRNLSSIPAGPTQPLLCWKLKDVGDLHRSVGSKMQFCKFETYTV